MDPQYFEVSNKAQQVNHEYEADMDNRNAISEQSMYNAGQTVTHTSEAANQQLEYSQYSCPEVSDTGKATHYLGYQYNHPLPGNYYQDCIRDRYGDGRIHLPYTDSSSAVDMTNRHTQNTPGTPQNDSTYPAEINLVMKEQGTEKDKFSNSLAFEEQQVNNIPTTNSSGPNEVYSGDNKQAIVQIQTTVDQNNCINYKGFDHSLITREDTTVSKVTKGCQEVDHKLEYTCGGCLKTFSIVCNLHIHMKAHSGDGSYYFNHSNLTAYPRFETCTKDTQTEIEVGNKNHPKLRAKRNRKKAFNKVDTVSNENIGETSAEPMDLMDMGTRDEDFAGNDNFLEKGIKFERQKESDVPCNDFTVEIDNKMTELTDNDDGSDTDEYSPLESLRERKKKTKRKKGKNSKLSLKSDLKNGPRAKLEAKKRKMTKVKKKKSVKQENGIFTKEIPDTNKKDKIKDLKDGLTGKTVTKRVKKERVVIKRNEKIECMLCDITFPKRLNLRIHIRTMHSDLPHICTLCSLNCDNEEEMMEHRKNIHHRANHQCELCGKILSTKGMLEGHYLVHKGIKPFSCPVCVERTFTRKCQLKAHMETHLEEKNLQCEFCGKPFNARYLMINHVKHCSGNKPYKCKFCDMGFVSNHCLQRHLRTHTGEKPFVCEVCAFASGNVSCLARHMRTHTGEKPFVCKYCQQAFAAPGALKKHIRVHTQEKPYKCGFCTKAFTQRWNLKTHERQHTGETPYKCHVCGVGYKQNVLLKTHLKSHYGGLEQSSDTGNQSTSQALNQSVVEAINQSATQAMNQSAVQAMNQSVTQAMNQSVVQAMNQPVMTAVIDNQSILPTSSQSQSSNLLTDIKALPTTDSHLINQSHISLSQSHITDFQHSSLMANQILMSGIANSMYTSMS